MNGRSRQARVQAPRNSTAAHTTTGWPLHPYCDCQYSMVYSIQTEVWKWSRILSNNRAIVLHQGGQCMWAGGMNRWWIRAQQPRSERISCKGQTTGLPRPRGSGLPHALFMYRYIYTKMPTIYNAALDSECEGEHDARCTLYLCLDLRSAVVV